MSYDADTGRSPPAGKDDTHSVVESIMAKLDASPMPEQSGDTGDTREDQATGAPGSPGATAEAVDAEGDAVAEAVAELTGEPLHDVTIDGSKERVTLGELRKGYSRQRDYTRKTAALAEQRRGLEAERAYLKDFLESAIRDNEAGDPVLAEGRATDWAKLAAEQPTVYAQRRAAFEQSLARLDRVREARRRVDAEDQAVKSQALGAYASQQRAALLREIPELADPARRKAIDDELTAYASSQGFAPGEQRQILDHRLLKVFRDAAAYAKLRHAKDSMAGKRVGESSRTQSPRASRDGAARKSARLSALKRNALRTGRIDDVVESVLAHLEED